MYRQRARMLNSRSGTRIILPYAKPITVEIVRGGTIDIDLLANSIADPTNSSPEELTLTVKNITKPSRGVVIDNKDGTVTYTHDNSETKMDMFSYTVFNGEAESLAALVTVDVDDSYATIDIKKINDAFATLGTDQVEVSCEYEVEPSTAYGKARILWEHQSGAPVLGFSSPTKKNTVVYLSNTTDDTIIRCWLDKGTHRELYDDLIINRTPTTNINNSIHATIGLAPSYEQIINGSPNDLLRPKNIRVFHAGDNLYHGHNNKVHVTWEMPDTMVFELMYAMIYEYGSETPLATTTEKYFTLESSDKKYTIALAWANKLNTRNGNSVYSLSQQFKAKVDQDRKSVQETANVSANISGGIRDTILCKSNVGFSDSTDNSHAIVTHSTGIIASVDIIKHMNEIQNTQSTSVAGINIMGAINNILITRSNGISIGE